VNHLAGLPSNVVMSWVGEGAEGADRPPAHPGSADDPLVSPVTADLSGLPPMLIQAGTGDPFVADAHRLAEHARRRGVPVRLELYPLATHAFHIYWSFLPAAADALQQVDTFIQGVTSDSQGGPKRYTSSPGREE
jgi:acetyl esterase/lipase